MPVFETVGGSFGGRVHANINPLDSMLFNPSERAAPENELRADADNPGWASVLSLTAPAGD
jgi:hypothetical protein